MHATSKTGKKKNKSKAPSKGGALVVVEEGRRAPRSLGRGNLGDDPYFLALMDPEDKRGCKVPHEPSLPSGTWAFAADFTATTDASGNQVVFINPLALVNSGSSGASAAICAGNSTAGYGSVGNPVTNVQNNPAVTAIMQKARVVSAYVVGWSTESAQNVTGMACSFLIPSNANLNVALSTFQSFLNLPYSIKKHAILGGFARWIPDDIDCFSYANVAGGGSINVLGLNNGSVNAVGTAGSADGSPVIGIAISGATAGKVWAFRTVINMEFIPSADSLDFVNRDVMPSRPQIVEKVEQFVNANRSESLFSPMLNAITGAIGSAARYAMGGAVKAIVGNLGIPTLGALTTAAAMPALRMLTSNRVDRDTLRSVAPSIISGTLPRRY